jgi:hypothetical protein
VTKLGFEIMAINMFKSRGKDLETAMEATMAVPNIVFAARGEGMGKNTVMISMHKDYADYSKYIGDLLSKGSDCIEDHDTMLVSLKDLIVKPFSLKYLAGAIHMEDT